ncbi:hypothetical protein DT73_20030 [Mangrovibacter sp. MFB070]|nr:hypothetical protein DT73_20030 [Mangrovibacter sp. MFB070]
MYNKCQPSFILVNVYNLYITRYQPLNLRLAGGLNGLRMSAQLITVRRTTNCRASWKQHWRRIYLHPVLQVQKGNTVFTGTEVPELFD